MVRDKLTAETYQGKPSHAESKDVEESSKKLSSEAVNRKMYNETLSGSAR